MAKIMHRKKNMPFTTVQQLLTDDTNISMPLDLLVQVFLHDHQDFKTT